MKAKKSSRQHWMQKSLRGSDNEESEARINPLYFEEIAIKERNKGDWDFINYEIRESIPFK